VDLSLTKETGLGEINHLAAALVTLVTGIGDSLGYVATLPEIACCLGG
jgi:hypothetical protein